ncbi:MAG: c-type cytochrome [Candidatus Obscuribacterales bacterium]|nr:c-type cytochrome [Candidatus Obscuribacterales bacterium]
MNNYGRLILTVAVVSCLGFLCSVCEAKKTPNGEHLYKQHCASCHFAGGNRVKAGKDVAGSTHLSSLPVFKAYLSKPPGHMPHYQHLVSNEALLKALYQYCKTLKSVPMKQAMTN